MQQRNYSVLDNYIIAIDDRFSQFFLPANPTVASYPADHIPDTVLPESERRKSIGLMRVNHAGEVAAQALYQSQSMLARNNEIRHKMRASAVEEIDHLEWCEKRLAELGGSTSRLRKGWFFGSFIIGALAGLAGDKWSLGFIVETENQVVAHLDKHLHKISAEDMRSRAILQRMREDEARHASAALHAGATILPTIIKKMMSYCAKIMTRTAYWI